VRRARREIEIRKITSLTHEPKVIRSKLVVCEIVRVLFDSDFKEADRTYGWIALLPEVVVPAE